MQAITIEPGGETLRFVERPEPSIKGSDEVKVRILRVGICGTDREEVHGGRARAPENYDDLVIGHEMIGRAVEVGESVQNVQPGDYGVFTVRRGCNNCLPCKMQRPDMCRTGDYRERGIWGLDGYQTEFVVDKERYFVKVADELEGIGVLSEPLSVGEKAIDEAVRLQFARLPDSAATPDWLNNRRCLVAGLGPIGLLAAMALRLRGAQVYGLDVVDPDSARPKWLVGIGGQYVDGRQVPVDRVDKILGAMDLIFESAGVAALELNLLDALAPNGIYVVTGLPEGDRLIKVSAAPLIRQLVLNNQVLIGSVNAARGHFQKAVDDLEYAQLKWGKHIEKLITNRYVYKDFETALRKHPANEIKTIIEWSQK